MIYSLQVTHTDLAEMLAEDRALRRAVEWSAAHGIAALYISAFEYGEDGRFLSAADADLKRLRGVFEAAGIAVHGRINPVHCTRPSTGWPEAPCPSDARLSERLGRLFARTAARFDRVIVDNRLFFDCTCAECDARRKGRAWGEFHREELNRVLRNDVLAQACAANPQARVIWKFPSWYEMMPTRGYDAAGQTALFSQTCAGVETRDPLAAERWGGRQPYGAYFAAAYFRAANREKCRMAWFDAYACDSIVYAAQAWGAALAGCSELSLFSYGSLRQEHAEGYEAPTSLAANLARMRPALEKIVHLVKEHPLRGIAAIHPPLADPLHEPYLFDYLGMMGLPMAPWYELPHTPEYGAAFCQASGNIISAQEAAGLMPRGIPVMITSRLREMRGIRDLPETIRCLDTHRYRFTDRIARLRGDGIQDVSGLPRADAWFEWDVNTLEALRAPFYAKLGLPMMRLPARVGVFPAGGAYVVLANYNSHQASIRAPGRCEWQVDAKGDAIPGTENTLAGGAIAAFTL